MEIGWAAAASADFRLSCRKMMDLIRVGALMGWGGVGEGKRWQADDSPVPACVAIDAACQPAHSATSPAATNPLDSPGDVNVNWRPSCKPSSDVKAGDVISVAGKGRLEVKAASHTQKGTGCRWCGTSEEEEAVLAVPLAGNTCMERRCKTV